MGNCLTSNKIVSEDEKLEPPPSESEVPSKLRPTKSDGKKRMVRFKLHKEGNVDTVDTPFHVCQSPDRYVATNTEGHGESKDEVVRIKLVVTKEELKQILSYKEDFKHSSVEKLVSAIKLRGRLISDVEPSEGGVNGAWRPALESIPEDH